MTAQIHCGDAIDWLNSLPEKSCDLIFFSPPYEDCRSYGLPNMVDGQKWVDWMVEVFRASIRCCKGLVAAVVEGKTRKFKYSATPFLLVADLHRQGFNLRKPCCYKRHGIPGSGGPDWWKNQWEPIICVTSGKLPWSDNTAHGHAPKFGPGGEFSNRRQDGSRVNESTSERYSDTDMERLKETASQMKISRRAAKVLCLPARHTTSGKKDGDILTQKTYLPPKLANGGNVIDCGAVGGGHLGSQLAHENDAPYPENLVEPFVLCFCPPGGIVADPFCGSGTTLKVALKHGRQAKGCDIRQSQVDLTKSRLEKEMSFFGEPIVSISGH